MATQRVFLSYSRRDNVETDGLVDRIKSDLESGVARSIGEEIDAWFDRDDMEGGRRFRVVIDRAIAHADRMIAFTGPGSIASAEVRGELERAQRYGREVLPVLIREVPTELIGGDATPLPEALSGLHYVDFTNRPYEAALAELTDQLRRPLVTLADLPGVPAIVDEFVDREELAVLQKLVLPDRATPCDRRTTVVHGMIGAGKTALAAAYARLPDTRRTFSDGIFWVRAPGHDNSRAGAAGREREQARSLADITDAMCASHGVERREPLQCLLRRFSVLLVLDDASSVADATPYRRVISDSPGSRLVVTSNNDLADNQDDDEINDLHLRELSDDAALQLLANWDRCDVTELPDEAVELAQACGNLPLALALCGAMVREDEGPNRWRDVLELLEHAELDWIGADGDATLTKLLAVGVEALASPPPCEHDCAVDRYHDLAVFSGREPEPETAVVRLWTRDRRLAARHARRLLTIMRERELLTIETHRGRDGRPSSRSVSLHPIQHRYVTARATEAGNLPTRLHGELVATYGEACGGDWPSGDDDGYYFQRLRHHMVCAGRHLEADRLLLDDRWLQAKLDAESVSYWDVADEYEAFAGGDPTRLVDAVAESPHGSPDGKARILRVLGAVYEDLGRRGVALDALTTAAELASEADQPLRASILIELGKILFHLGRFDESLQAHREVREIFEQRDAELEPAERGEYGWWVEWWGEQLRNMGRLDEALPLHERARELGRLARERRLEAHAVGNIGAVHHLRDDYGPALTCWKEALEICRDVGDQPRAAHYLVDVGYLSMLDGDLATARQFLADGLELAEELGAHEVLVRGLMNLGTLRFIESDWPGAQDAYQRALDLSGDEEVPRLSWRIEHNLGNVALQLGDPDSAEHHFRAAVDQVEAMAETYDTPAGRRGFLRGRLAPFKSMIRLCAARGDTDEARTFERRGLDSSLAGYLERRLQGVDLAREETDNRRFFFGRCYVETE